MKGSLRWLPWICNHIMPPALSWSLDALCSHLCHSSFLLPASGSSCRNSTCFLACPSLGPLPQGANC